MIAIPLKPEEVPHVWDRVKPLIEKANTIAAGMRSIIVLSFSTKIFLTAGSKSQAIAAVPPATPKDNKSAINILKKCFFI